MTQQLTSSVPKINESAAIQPKLRAMDQSLAFSEEYDISQRQLRGNLPQAFVHAQMLECACRLAQPPDSKR